MFIRTNLKLSLLIHFSLNFVIIDLHRLVRSPPKIALNYICWFETVSGDE